MLWCLVTYSATLWNRVPTFPLILFGSFELCSEVETDYSMILNRLQIMSGACSECLADKLV